MKDFGKLIQPYIVIIGAMVVIPMLLILIYAFSKTGNNVMTFVFTLDNFRRFFDPVFIKVLIKSLEIAVMTTVICLLIGYPVAYVVARVDEKYSGILLLLITLPMWINMLVRTYAWIGIISDAGLINNLLGYFGFQPIKMLYTDFAVVLGMVYNSLPKAVINASYDLGANRFQTFTRIVFPLSVPGVISGITLVFLPAVSTFVIPKLLGGGQYMLIGNLIENQFISVGEWNFGSAISLIMALVIMASMYLAKKFDKNIEEESVKGVKLW